MRTRGGIVPWRLVGPRGEEEVVASGPLIADEVMFVRQAVIEGLGLGVAPAGHGQGGGPSGAAGAPAAPLWHWRRRLFLLWPGRRLVPSRVAVVCDFLAEELARTI
jgi:DNA-binding transcriptional LysR family regulator